MKQPVAESATKAAFALLTVVFLLFASGVATARAQTPAASPSPTAAKADKKPKKNRGVSEPKEMQDEKNAGTKEIPLPLQPGSPVKNLTIPQTDLTGRLLSQIMAVEATRLDDERVQMKEMKMDLNHPDGKEDFHVILPTSIFNLKTRIITSDDAVTIQTQDFELTGEGMEFNTVDRTGKLAGKVRMIVHNLKQAVARPEPTPKPE